MTWYERRALAIEMATHCLDYGRARTPDRGPCIGRVFMTRTAMHLPGWPRALSLLGFVPASVGGLPGTLPSSSSLDQHFQRRERRQNREKF